MKCCRKTFTFFVILGLIWTLGEANDYGIKMYYNFAKNSWTNPDNNSSLQENYASKYAIGAYIEFRLVPFFSLSAEGLLSKKGGIISPPAKKGIEYRLSYLSLPLLVKIYVIPVGPAQLFISGGLEYSYLIEGKTYDLDLEEELNDNFKDKLERTDISYLLGGGLRFNLVVTRIVLEGRYSIGQKNLFLPEYLEEGEFFKNRVFSFGIGFTF
jgi:hypothetical protein